MTGSAGPGKETADNSARFRTDADDVFARIAGRYDRLCDVFSLFIHRAWKNRMARQVLAEDWRTLLDLASGTGDIPLRVLRRLDRDGPGAERRLRATDLCPQMLAVARAKPGSDDPRLAFERLDACDLSVVEPGSIDVLSISFGMKIVDRRRVLEEAFRVLRPGGVFLCLEAARIPSDFWHGLYLAYMDACLPLIGRLATGGDAGAYTYLLRGIHAFPAQQAFADELAALGFAEVGFENLTFGIVALHRAVKPAD